MANESRDQTEARDLLLELAMKLETVAVDPAIVMFASAVIVYLRAENVAHVRAMAVVEAALHLLDRNVSFAEGVTTLRAACVAQDFIDKDGKRKPPSNV